MGIVEKENGNYSLGFRAWRLGFSLQLGLLITLFALGQPTYIQVGQSEVGP